jgi:hypothetical protein
VRGKGRFSGGGLFSKELVLYSIDIFLAFWNQHWCMLMKFNQHKKENCIPRQYIIWFFS